MPSVMPPALVAALMRESVVAECVRTQSDYTDKVYPAGQYLAGALKSQSVTLKTGEQMTVITGETGCFGVGQSARVYIYERTGSAYRKVLDTVTLPDLADPSSDGSITLPTHETMNIIMESVYVWDGRAYVFAPSRSTEYYVGLDVRIPYETEVRFAPGASSATIAGTYAEGFGPSYVFKARKGQRITIDVLSYGGKDFFTSLFFGDKEVTGAEMIERSWSGLAPHDGTYTITVFGGEKTGVELHNFKLRLTILL